MGATAATVAVITAAAAAGSAYMQGQNERQALKQQYKIEEYNAQMDKMEQEVDLATQEKLLQKQLAETMATQNNLFGESGLEGSTGNLLKGTYLQGVEETRELQAQQQYVQNRYITTSAIRRKNFNKNLKNNAWNTAISMITGGIAGGAQGYSIGSDMSGSKPATRKGKK